MMNRNDAHKGKEETDISVHVMGVGGGGNNSINRLHRMGVYGATTVAVNTDKEHLNNIHSDKKMLIGGSLNKGKGTGGVPNVGRECAKAASGGFNRLFSGSDLVFLTAGMGGGTGTGAAPVIARIARRKGAMVIAILTLPFSVEGNRKKIAWNGIKRVNEFANSTIVLKNDKLLEVAPDLPLDQGFGVMDSLISDLIKNLTETVTLPSLINLDFNDLRSVLGGGGVSTLLMGESNINEPEKAVKEANENPFLDVDYTGAKKALIHVTGGPKELSIQKMNDVVGMMTSKLDSDAGVIFGARIDPDCTDKIRIMSIVSDLDRGGINRKKGNTRKDLPYIS